MYFSQLSRPRAGNLSDFVVSLAKMGDYLPGKTVSRKKDRPERRPFPMLFPRSPLCRAVIAAALALALAGCGSRGARASAAMLSGGGSVSDHQEASDHQGPTSSDGASEAQTPSFQELPSSSESSSSSSEAAPPASSSEASSSEAPPSSSSQAPVSSQVPVSSQPEEQQPRDEEEQPDEEEEPDDDWDDQDDGGEDEEPEEDEPNDDWSDKTSDWEDLKVRSGGSTVSDSAVSIVARIVQTEMGSSFPDEALKAQAVAAYTFVRYHNSVEGNAPSVILSNSVSDRVNRLVREVAGEQISYNGKPILATYCAMSAGTTTSAQSVWGSALPYLVPVDSKGDKKAANYCVETTMSASSVRKKLENYLDVDLDGVSPKNWFNILSYWDGGPYVNKVSIAGQKETTGRVLRESILGLRSAAFEVEYDKVSNEFTFTTYGYGHGVGMSQMGAKYCADQGWDYVDILEHYYSGTTVG